MAGRPWGFEELTPENHAAIRRLILEGLAEHWGPLDESLNPDLDDLFASYPNGRTVVARRGLGIIGTGTLVPRSTTTAEIVRMSVARAERRNGIGRAIVDELLDTARRWRVAAVILETSTVWPEVVAFYCSCGFSITHTELGDFGENTWFRIGVEEGSQEALPSQPR